jgi:hypothetical protein
MYFHGACLRMLSRSRFFADPGEMALGAGFTQFSAA